MATKRGFLATLLAAPVAVPQAAKELNKSLLNARAGQFLKSFGGKSTMVTSFAPLASESLYASGAKDTRPPLETYIKRKAGLKLLQETTGIPDYMLGYFDDQDENFYEAYYAHIESFKSVARPIKNLWLKEARRSRRVERFLSNPDKEYRYGLVRELMTKLGLNIGS